MKYIGKIKGGRDVNIGVCSPNNHLVITGVSGSGKSVRILDIEEHIVENGDTIIALDVNGTHEENKEMYCFNHISAQKDGLDMKILDMSLINEGRETRMNFIEYLMETLCPKQLRGACQLASVRRAIEFAIRYREKFSTDMEAIACGLKEQEDSAALGAYNHLCPILEGNIFRDSEKRILEHKVNVISLKGLNPKTQKRVVEIVLNVLWRQIRIEGSSGHRFTLVMDEFQNLDFSQTSVLFQMLTEARKYGVDLILATQTLAIFSKKELAVINQAATKLFFQQSAADLKKIADLIGSDDREKWISMLSRLRIGRAIAVGELEVGGRRLHQPIVTSSVYQKSNFEVEMIWGGSKDA